MAIKIVMSRTVAGLPLFGYLTTALAIGTNIAI